jgi:hypothetical protein
VCVWILFSQLILLVSAIPADVHQVLPALQPPVHRALLISKNDLLPLYTDAGFTLKGLSEVVHGADPWYECEASFE